MPAKSAPMLIVLAVKRAITNASNSHFGNRCLKFAANPCPVTLPMRAHIICTAAISGHVSSAVQRSLVPSCAPAMEYVAIPDGSSSAAPVMIPGPSDFSSDRSQRDGADFGKEELGWAFPSDQALTRFSLVTALVPGRPKEQNLAPAIDPRFIPASF